MSYKKYKKFLQRLEFHCSPTHHCTLYEHHGNCDDEYIIATYQNKCLEILHTITGESVREYYGNNNLDRVTYFDEENTKKMMLRTGSHDGEGLINEIQKRFGSDGDRAKDKIEDFCKAKGIDYKPFCY